MKKIVALVLAMVMVLGLATTAFAAAPAYLTSDVAGLTPASDLADYSYELKKHVDEIAVTDTFAKYVVWKTELETKAPAIEGYYVITSNPKSADKAFVNGSEITYLKEIVTGGFDGTWDLEVVKVPTVKAVLAEKCGDIFVKGDYSLYADASENLYFANSASTTDAYVGGEYVALTAIPAAAEVTSKALPAYDASGLAAGTVVFVTHNYDYDVDVANSVKTVKAVYCTVCKDNFQFVVGKPADAIKAFGADNFEDTGLDATAGDVFVALEAVAADTPAVDTEKVESAETFDAGIAMYVGMSVMAAAGSAVVLKKKD